MPITVNGDIEVRVVTPRLSAVFAGPKLIELRSASGEVLLRRDAHSEPAGLELLFADGDPVPIGRAGFSAVKAVAVSDTVAHVHVEDDNGDGFLRIAIAPSGELLVEPSGQTVRRGLGGVRLNLAGIAPDYKLVAPFFQGCRQELDCPLITGDWMWPQEWEAPLAILQGPAGGWSVRTHDARSLPKSLHVGHEDDPRTLGLDAEAIGPWDANTAVGSLVWIIDAHEGDWPVAVQAYRKWLYGHIGADALKALRPDWVHDIRLVLEHAPLDADLLAAVEKVIAPQHVIVHVGDWRSDPYDENYPDYVPSPAGKKFIAHALGRGFHVQPHFNHFAIDPSHTFFPRVREFMMRDVRGGEVHGWRWRESRRFAFPQSPSRLAALRDEKTMVYLHTGASTWRRTLVERLSAAVAELGVHGFHVDQTLATYNLQNGLVENLTSAEGMVTLMRELSALSGRPGISGEGLDEMIMRYLAFGTVPLFKSWRGLCPHHEQLDPVPVGHTLYGDLSRAFGAKGFSDDPAESDWCVETAAKLRTLPSLRVRRAAQIAQPTPGVRRILDRAMAGD